MSEFHSAEREFSQLISEHRFVSLYPMWTKSSIVISRKLRKNGITYCHLIISANGSGGIAVRLWVSALEYPDARLDSNSSAFQIMVGETWERNEEFLRICESRVINILPGLDDFDVAIDGELKNPSILTAAHKQRMENYFLYMKVLRWMREDAGYEAIKDVISNVVEKKGKSLSRAEKAIDEYIRKGWTDIEEAELREFIKEKIDAVISLPETLASYIYMQIALDR